MEFNFNLIFVKGFTDCFAIKASDFYRFHLSDQEKQRIENLELFDEYEPWNLKCTHYAMISACKGEFSTKIISDLYKTIDLKPKFVNQEICNQYPASLIKIRPFEVQFGIRYGHSVSRIGSKLVLTGGFGEVINDQSHKHMRHASIEIIDLEIKDVQVFSTFENIIGID